MVHKFVVATRQRYQRIASHRSASNSANNSQAILIRRRSALELFGAFLFIILLAAIGDSLHVGSISQTANNDANQPAAASNVQLTQTSSNDSSGAATANSDPTSSTGTSTQVTSDTNNGKTSTQVMVDGKPVSVPANGSKTITTPNGQTTISTSSNGSSVNSDTAQTNVNISSQVNSFNEEVNN